MLQMCVKLCRDASWPALAVGWIAVVAVAFASKCSSSAGADAESSVQAPRTERVSLLTGALPRTTITEPPKSN